MLRKRPHIFVGALVFSLVIALGQPNMLVESPCIWAAADWRVDVGESAGSVNETDVRRFAESLEDETHRAATVEAPYWQNGTFTQVINLAGDLASGVRLHTTRLVFTATNGSPPAHIDLHIYLVGPEAARVEPAAAEALEDMANIEAFHLKESLLGWFGPIQASSESSDRGRGNCCAPC